MARPGWPDVENRLTDEEFRDLWFQCRCSPAAVARARGVTERSVYARATSIRGRGIDLPSLQANAGYARPIWTYTREHRIDVRGVALFGSDLHMWPQTHQPRPLIQQVFLDFAHRIQPAAIVLGGDLVDGTRVSRHGRMRGQNTPRFLDETIALESWVNDLPAAEHRHVVIGNHDQRHDRYLAENAPEMEDFAGGLFDRVPGYLPSYTLTINETLEAMHNNRNGIHAARNNVVTSMISTATGHTHQLGCVTVPSRRGTLYGIEMGMLNDPLGPQFEYAENRPTRAQAGFAVVTFDDDGVMLPPELAYAENGRVIFRGRDLNKPVYRVLAVMGS